MSSPKQGIEPSRPVEVSIEVEPRCNFRCPFCFNDLSFAKQGRGKASLSTEYVKKVSEHVHQAGIPKISFTGGEPLLRPDILEILEHAGGLGFKEVWLNTNGSLLDEATALRLVRSVGYFSIPIQGSTAEEEARIAGLKDSLALKLNALRLLKDAGARFIRVLTVATRQVIADLEQIADMVADAPASKWELLRPTSGNAQFALDNSDVETLVDKMEALKEKGKVDCGFGGSIPFCAVKDPDRMDRLTKAVLPSIGSSRYMRFAVDPRGFAKPNFFTDIDIGDPLDPLACWRHPFMVELRTSSFLPEACADCRFKSKCLGGCRFMGKSIHGDYRAPDPLATDSARR
jgi:pyrroloquinoline quinone biosynthesis protein E